MDESHYIVKTPGNADLLRSTKAAVLNSRQSKTPVGNDPWVRSTIEAVKYAVESNLTVVTSFGMNTWELVLWACGEFGAKCIVVLPSDEKFSPVNKTEYFMQDYGLNLDAALCLSVQPLQKSRSSKAWWEERDKLIFDLAYEIIPVSIRKNGRWDSLLADYTLPGKVLNSNFSVIKGQKKGRSENPVIEIPSSGISYTWDLLTHWTRRFYTPWPGESSKDFYAKVVQSKDSYSHSALATLENIISERRLRGSPTRIKNQVPSVAFTGLNPSDSIKLMQWRSRYVRYTFEPYGIAIKKKVASDAGICPVVYVDRNKKEDPAENPSGEKFPVELTQGFGRGEWYKEKEWRYPGDLDLNQFNRDDIRVIVPTVDGARRIEAISPWKVIALENIGEID